MMDKRTEKILKMKGISQWVKPASDSDPVDFVMIEYPKCLRHTVLFKTKDYIEMVKRGETYPEELIHNITIRNKRDRQSILNKLITNKFVSIMYKNFRYGENIPIELFRK